MTCTVRAECPFLRDDRPRAPPGAPALAASGRRTPCDAAVGELSMLVTDARQTRRGSACSTTAPPLTVEVGVAGGAGEYFPGRRARCDRLSEPYRNKTSPGRHRTGTHRNALEGSRAQSELSEEECLMRYLRARSYAAVLVSGAACGRPGYQPRRHVNGGGGDQRRDSHARRATGDIPQLHLAAAYRCLLQRGEYRTVPAFVVPVTILDRRSRQAGRQSQLSLASTPVYSDNNTVVNLTLGKWNWSDGTPVTSRDVTFWINLLEANKKNIAFYIPGEFPDNLKSYKVTGPESIQLNLTGPVNPTWFTYDQLSQITPIPQQTWDKTSASGAIGNYDQTAAGAVQVFNFLTAQSKDIATYGTNPLWQTVDGPWKLNQYQSDGYVQFKANPAYSGPDTHAIEYFVEEPFTTDTAELRRAPLRQ